jgi:hypothetical protein
MPADSQVPNSAVAANFPIAWRSVSFATVCLSLGASLVLMGVVGLSVLMVLNVRVSIEPRIEGVETRDQLLPAAFFGIAFVFLLAGVALWLAALCLCCVVPAETGARPLAAAAAVCWLLFLFLALQIPLAPLVGIRIPLPRVAEQALQRRGDEPHRFMFANDVGFGLTALVLAIASAGFTLTLVCAIAHHFKNETLARSARRLLLYQAVALPTCALIGLVHGSVADAWRHVAWYWVDFPFAVAVPVILVMGCIWLQRLLSRVRQMLHIAEENALAFAETKTPE